jgi:G:T-mismatch repair DNA endonuclease (very short patch repair protein)
MDIVDKDKHSTMMAAVRLRDTAPEVARHCALFRMASFLLSDRQTLVMFGPLAAEALKGGC